MIKKRKSPKEVIESHDPKVEHAYIKFPGKEIEEVTSHSGPYFVGWDINKIRGLLKLKESRQYTAIHNHPGGNTKPSLEDIEGFLNNKKMRTMVIAAQDKKSGMVGGYLVLRKTKKTNEGFSTMESISYEILSDLGLGNYAFENSIKNHNLNYRFVPSQGYERKPNSFRFVPVMEQNRELEYKIVSSFFIGLGFIIGMSFLLPQVTGLAIINLNRTVSNMIGGIFFILSFIVLIYLIRSLLIKTKNDHPNTNQKRT